MALLYANYLVLLLLFLGSTNAQRTCYYSDGTIADGYSACSNTTEHSGCCRLWQSNGGPVDLCTTNGLCLGRNGVWNGFFFQSGCTDSTWTSAGCPKACPALATPESSIIQPCNASSGGLWCCRPDRTASCCNSAKAVAIGQLILPVAVSSSVSTLSLSSSSTATSASTSSSTTATTGTAASTAENCTTNTPPAQVQKQVNTATIGVGASLGMAFLATLAMLIWREWSWRRRPVVGGVVQGGVSESEVGASEVEIMRERERKVELNSEQSVYHELEPYGHEHQELEGLNRNRF